MKDRAIDRRAFVRALSCGLAACALRAGAQSTARLWRIGYLDQGSAARDQLYVDALRQGLHELGWNAEAIALETRFAEGKTDRLPALAADLVRSRVDIIVTWSTPAALAAKNATSTIPIVIGFTADPVGSRIVASLAHPGANVTGWTHLGLELRAKYLELLKEAVPDAVRFGVLWNPTNQVHAPSMKVVEEAARRLNVELYPVGVQDPRALEGGFATLGEKRVQALIVFPDGMFIAQTPLVVALVTRARLPAMFGVSQYAEAGGLMTYGANLADMQRRLGASFVDRILKGANPASLPVEQPTKFDLVINLKTAKALGLTLPQSLLLRADEVIQ